MQTPSMDLDFLVSVVLFVFLVAVMLLLLYNLVRRRGIHGAFNAKDESNLTIEEADISSPDGITGAFNAEGNAKENINKTTIDTNTHRPSGEHDESSIGIFDVLCNLIREFISYLRERGKEKKF